MIKKEKKFVSNFFSVWNKKKKKKVDFLGNYSKQYRLFIIILLCFTSGCAELREKAANTNSWMQEEQRVRLLCTTEHVSALARAVGGERAYVLTLIEGQNDPHSYQIVKGDDMKFRRAHIVFCSGLMLEQGLTLERYLNRYSAHSVGDYIQQQTHGAILLDVAYDPHMWNDLHLWSYGLFFIADELSKIRPEYSSYFQKNAREAFSRYQALHKEFKERMQRIDKTRRYLVTTHDAFSYFCRAYLSEEDELSDDRWRERYMAIEGCAPESQISTRDLQRVIDYIRLHDLHSVCTETGVNKDSIQKVVEICREKGCNVIVNEGVLSADSLGVYSTYEEAMRHNIDEVSSSLMRQ